MDPTPRELTAARRLGDALLELIRATQEAERLQRRREERPPLPPQHPVNPPPPGLLTKHEAAAFLSISTGTLFNMSAPRGPIPIVRIGTSVRYSLSDLQAAAEAMKQQGPAGAKLRPMQQRKREGANERAGEG